ncbi:MAG: bifunctional oligoribonuclease/PAP phosphatase NrnA [Candidatus Riflebacteria bacterium]|nr:bifunctional oligoribonuclease/PAP phosphatase NrnA [Candidatus Riflebacteria bacterium]
MKTSLCYEREFELIRKLLVESKSFLSIAHPYCDGDALGSQLALHNYCVSHGKKSVPLNFEPIPIYLQWVQGVEDLKDTLSDDEFFDVIFLMEPTDISRLGDRVKFFKRARKIVHLDHHLNLKGAGDINVIDSSASSTCEILYEIFDGLNEKLDQGTLHSLYLGIMTDTGNFRFPNTSRKTHEIAGSLIERGVDPSRCFKLVYEANSFPRVVLHGLVMSRAKMSHNEKVIHSCLFQKDFDDLGASEVESDGAINNLTTITGTEVAVLFREKPNDEIKVSFRSAGKVDVQRISSIFGGGGHKLASGANIKGEMTYAINLAMTEIEKALNYGS